jgi:hypothetical protein
MRDNSGDSVRREQRVDVVSTNPVLDKNSFPERIRVLS